MRNRFWVEAALGGLSAILLGLTMFVSDWIEVAFRIDPDRHSGSLEWAIVAALVASTVVSGVLACSEWRRPALSLSETH